ncbi:MAG: hypothetical protein KF847_19750 [Pirellulales bacterium]|nr:hypothetical protein [Pirellulales bacterium]
MNTDSIKSLLAQHGDERMEDFVAAECGGWGDILEYLRIGYEAGLQQGGVWECEHCRAAVEDPAHPDYGGETHILDDGSGCGDTIICEACYQAAKEARAKIVVECDAEGNVIGTLDDDSSLTDEEKTLAAYLQRNQEGNARNARSMIGEYPRGERRQLHRYQDQIDADARRRGKTLREGLDP